MSKLLRVGRDVIVNLKHRYVVSNFTNKNSSRKLDGVEGSGKMLSLETF